MEAGREIYDGCLWTAVTDTSNRSTWCRLRLKCDGTRAETRFRLSTKRTSPFKSARASVQSTTGRWAVHISLQGLYCSCKPVFCSHVTLTGYQLHSLVSPSILLPCVTVCHHISTGLYQKRSATVWVHQSSSHSGPPQLSSRGGGGGCNRLSTPLPVTEPLLSGGDTSCSWWTNSQTVTTKQDT